jgi:hypothetical protein
MEKKRCPRCRRWKKFDEFSWKSQKERRLSSECKNCHNKLRRKYYKENKAKEVRRVTARKKETQRWYMELKTNLVCPCGEDHPACLEFHHRGRKKKGEILSLAATRYGWSKKRILKETKKCDVLCSNCHRKKHWKKKVPA